MDDLEDINLGESDQVNQAGAFEPIPDIAPRRRRISATYRDAPVAPWEADLIKSLPDKQQSRYNDPFAAPEPPIVRGNRKRIDQSQTVAATLDIPFNQAYDGWQYYVPEMEKKAPNLFKESGTSLMRGIGATYVTLGQAYEYLFTAPGAASTYVDFGKSIQKAYMPKLKPPEVAWSNFINPEWYATTVAEALPAPFALVAAALVGAYTTVTIGAPLALGAFGTTVLGALGATALTRPMESAMEAAQAKETALGKGMSEAEANAAADRVFYQNLSLAGLDVAQIAAAFTPLKVLGSHAPKALTARILATTARIGATALSEGGEEAIQQAFQESATEGLGVFESLKRFSPEMKESAMVGSVFGVGLPVAGSAFNALTERVTNTMKPGMAQTYQLAEQTGLSRGLDPVAAKVVALDALAETPDGKAHIEKVMGELKDIADGKEIAPLTAEEMQADIDKFGSEKEFVMGDIEEGVDIASDEILDSVISGETSIEGILGVEPELQDGFAVKAADGTIVVDPMALRHADMDLSSVNLDDIVETGFVKDGKFTTDPKEGAEAVKNAMARIGASETAPSFLVSEESYQAAVASLKEKTSGLHAGIDPLALADLVKIGAYHLERGVRNFAEWSKLMIERFGDTIKAHLDDVWAQSNDMVKRGVKSGVDLGEQAVADVKSVEGATMPAGEVKKQIRRITGQAALAKTISEDVALRAGMKKAEQAAREAYRAGNKDAQEQAKADLRDILIKAKVKAEMFGFREGFKVGERLTNRDLTQAFKDDMARIEGDRKALVGLIQEHLPPELRGKYLDAIRGKLTESRINDVLDRIARESEKSTKNELIEEIAEFKDYGGSLDVEYQKRIDELLGDVNTKNISPKTLQRLESLIEYADRHGMPSGINRKMRADLNRLEMRQASEMTVDELRTLRDVAAHLTEMGKLKRKLQLKYNERERSKRLDVLLKDTHNLDFNDSGNRTRLDTWKKGVLDLHLATLSPLRVTEMADGWKNGPNREMAKRLSRADTNANWETRTRTMDAITEIAALPEKIDFTNEDTQARLMVNILNMQGADQQVLTLMDRFGWQEIPELSPSELSAIGILRKYATQKTDQIAALWEETKNTEFVRLPEYIMGLKYEGEYDLGSADALLQTPYRTAQTEQGFGIERIAGVKKMPRIDVLGVFEQTISEQEWFLNMQPELDNVRRLVNKRKYLEKAGPSLTNWWLDHLDIIARRGWTAAASRANQSGFNKWLKLSRGNITTAILGFRLSSILMQPMAIFDALAYVSAEHGARAAGHVLKQFSQTWISPAHFQDIFKRSKALQTRNAGEVSIEELQRSKKGKLIGDGLAALKWADVRTAAGIQQGIEDFFTSEGIANAHEEAETVMQLVSSSSDVTLRPHILARGEGARTLLTFQTFLMNRWGITLHDLVIKGVIKGDFKKKMAALIGLGFLVMADEAEKEVREFLYGSIKRQKEKKNDIPLWARAPLGLMSSVPLFGSGFEMVASRGGTEIPLTKLINDTLRSLAAPLKAGEETKGKTIGKALFKGAEAVAIIAGGKPGTSQAFDVLEGVLFPEDGKDNRVKPRAVKPTAVKQ